MNKLILLLIIIIAIPSCGEDQCFESFLFRFQTTNTLSTEEVSVGESFNIIVEFPNMIMEQKSGELEDVSDFPFIAAFTFKEFSSKSVKMSLHPMALDDFDVEVIEGSEMKPNFVVLATSTESHSFYCAPEHSSNGRSIELKITPRKTGVFFIFLQNGTDLEHSTTVDFDDDDCIDTIYVDYSNVSANNYDFLEGDLQEPDDSQGDFLVNWSGIAFKVVE